MILPKFYMNFHSKFGRFLVMFDGYENYFLRFDIFVGDKKYLKCSQRKRIYVTCPNATKIHPVEYRLKPSGWTIPKWTSSDNRGVRSFICQHCVYSTLICVGVLEETHKGKKSKCSKVRDSHALMWGSWVGDLQIVSSL